MHGVGLPKSSSSLRSMSLLSPMYTHVHPVPSTYTPDVLGVFARIPFLVNGHTCVPAHGGIADLAYPVVSAEPYMLRSTRRDVPSALNLLARVRAEEDRAAGPGVQRYPLP